MCRNNSICTECLPSCSLYSRKNWNSSHLNNNLYAYYCSDNANKTLDSQNYSIDIVSSQNFRQSFVNINFILVSCSNGFTGFASSLSHVSSPKLCLFHRVLAYIAYNVPAAWRMWRLPLNFARKTKPSILHCTFCGLPPPLRQTASWVKCFYLSIQCYFLIIRFLSIVNIH